MYGYESWSIKKAECHRIEAFELWCWRRLLRVPWTARRSNQSILKEISPECWLEGLMLKLKLQYFGHLIWRTDSLEKPLMLGKIEGRRRGWQRMRRLDASPMHHRCHWMPSSMGMSLSKLRELVMDRDVWRAAVHGVTESDMTERLNWTSLTYSLCFTQKSIMCSWESLDKDNSRRPFPSLELFYLDLPECINCFRQIYFIIQRASTIVQDPMWSTMEDREINQASPCC